METTIVHRRQHPPPPLWPVVWVMFCGLNYGLEKVPPPPRGLWPVVWVLSCGSKKGLKKVYCICRGFVPPPSCGAGLWSGSCGLNQGLE